MKKSLYIICISIIALSCERRELTYDYDPTVAVVLNVDWSDLSETPSGMSVYCYPESGETPTLVTRNINSTSVSVTVNLAAGNYNILVFNQIPSDFGTVSFDGLTSFETAQVNAASTSSDWAFSKSDSELVRDPEEVAIATYLNLEITEEDVREKLYLDSQDDVIADQVFYKEITVAPQVVIRTTRVKIRLAGIYNFSAVRATLYGMATGYNISDEKSHTDKATHVLESWSSTTFDDYREGEITAYHTSFGMPGQTTETRSYDYSEWDGQLDIEFLLVDNQTIESASYTLKDVLTLSADEAARSDQVDQDDIDIYFDIDYNSDDTPITLPDVMPEGGASSGFDATVRDWGDEISYDIPL